MCVWYKIVYLNFISDNRKKFYESDLYSYQITIYTSINGLRLSLPVCVYIFIARNIYLFILSTFHSIYRKSSNGANFNHHIQSPHGGVDVAMGVARSFGALSR